MSDVAAAALEARAWTQWFREPLALAETAQALIRQGLALDDVGLECLGWFFAVRPLVAQGADAQADRALDVVEQRCYAARQIRVLRLVNDLRAVLWLRRGEVHRAWSLAHAADMRTETGRSPTDQIVSALGLAEIAMQRADFDEVLEQGYRAWHCAASLDIPAAKAIALHNLAANQLNLLNLEDALPLQQQAQLWLERAEMAWVLPHVWENLILIHDVQGRFDEAARVLAHWRAQVGAFSVQEQQAKGVAIALGLLASGQAEQALKIVDVASPDARGDRHRTSAWVWAKGRVLLGLGQAEQARAVCEEGLAAAAAQPHAQTPYNLVRLHDVVREACEILGDFRAALQAHKAAQQASLPLLGHSARARYLSLKLQQKPPGAPRRRAAHGRARLDALDSSISALQRSMQQAPAPGSDVIEQGRLVAYLGHEIRAVLTQVMGVNALLQQSRLDPWQSRQVSLATKSVRGALALVNDILDLARLEAGRLELDCQPVDITQLTLELTGAWAAAVREKGLDLVVDVQAGQAAVLADGPRLRHVLSTLLGNALKHAEAGRVTVQVHRREAGPGMQAVHVAVEDTGESISTAALATLFSELPSVQAGPQPHRGAGLALVLSRQLLRRMGSDLEVHSQQGQGTTFGFTLTAPLALAGAADGHAMPSPPPPCDGAASGARQSH